MQHLDEMGKLKIQLNLGMFAFLICRCLGFGPKVQVEPDFQAIMADI